MNTFNHLIKQINFRIIVVLIVTILVTACNNKLKNKVEQEHPNITQLKKNSAEFTPEIIKMNANVYVAVGYDGSNAAMLIGKDGVIIIDALRALGAAEKVASEFKKISNKPVKALIYTHGHLDHTGGTSAFVGTEKNVKIIAREGFKKELQEHSPVQNILEKRNGRQFGRNLPKEDIINRGVAAGSTSKDRVNKGYIKPNTFFKDSLFVNIAGVSLEIYKANGETNDALFVWCPKEKVLFSGDNYYKAFPNLYAIRGSKYRDVKSWGEVIKKMSTFPVEYLVPGHTRPISGRALVNNNLKNYSAAILSVYNQTIDCMNKGYSLQQTVDNVKLSKELASQSNLQEFYGSVQWGVRSIYLHYVGWFDGNPTNLYPLSSKEEADNMIELAGGEKKIFKNILKAEKEGNYQFGLQLTDYLLNVNYKKDEVSKMKIKLLRKLASQQINAPARNYYLSYAYELEENIKQ
ncbi:alkyl/aryl-sulfatase [Lutibacter citreus]|uniref:alkyl/aryl-sulfatase n=1 Tax=Lutibacter citreus TaxID=2138210 RepID=UPI000DBE6502|nr:alkyl/aryl-sulfatase [Lutibacter citreus]